MDPYWIKLIWFTSFEIHHQHHQHHIHLTWGLKCSSTDLQAFHHPQTSTPPCSTTRFYSSGEEEAEQGWWRETELLTFSNRREGWSRPESHHLRGFPEKRPTTPKSKPHCSHSLSPLEYYASLLFSLETFLGCSVSRPQKRFCLQKDRTVHTRFTQVNPCFNQVNDPFSPCGSGHARNIWKDINMFLTNFHLIYRGNWLQ